MTCSTRQFEDSIFRQIEFDPGGDLMALKPENARKVLRRDVTSAGCAFVSPKALRRGPSACAGLRGIVQEFDTFKNSSGISPKNPSVASHRLAFVAEPSSEKKGGNRLLEPNATLPGSHAPGSILRAQESQGDAFSAERAAVAPDEQGATRRWTAVLGIIDIHRPHEGGARYIYIYMY